ncbi:carbonic anhydrase 14 [Pelodytes ibericus]
MSILSTCPAYTILQSSILILSVCLTVVGSSSWTYTGHNGQENWKESYPDCGGTAQSPINIKTANVSYDDSLPAIQAEGYSTPNIARFNLSNNGHTVVLQLPPSMRLRGLPNNFTAVQLHLHWGSHAHPTGSEHQIDRKAFPAEMHIVHYNSDKYTSIGEAKSMPNGLAVLGIIIEMGTTDNPAYDNIFNYLENVRYADQKIEVPSFNVHQLLPDRLDQYFRYRGSLTTPPCYQSVLWTVFHHKVQLSMAQLEKLQTLVHSTKFNSPPELLQNNVRQPQALNQRTVYTSRPLTPPGSLSTGKILGLIFGILLGLLGIFCIVFFVYRKYRRNRTEAGGKPNDNAVKSPTGPSERVEVKSFHP